MLPLGLGESTTSEGVEEGGSLAWTNERAFESLAMSWNPSRVCSVLYEIVTVDADKRRVLCKQVDRVSMSYAEVGRRGDGG